MSVTELIDEVGRANKEARALYKLYKELKDKEDVLRVELVEKLHKTGLKSAKTDMFNASISERSDIVVTHEQSVLDWLKETPDIETDQYIGLKTTNFKTLARALRKDTGEIVPGTEVVTSETLTIKGVK